MIIVGIAILLVGALIAWLLYRLSVQLSRQHKDLLQLTDNVVGKLSTIENDVRIRSSVSDPFKVANKTVTPGSSSKHIIKRKTPDQIRNENIKKIKEGQEYGWAE